MLSKLSRFLTIATLTTLTCVITHPVNAETAEMEVITPTTEMETSPRFNFEELINEAFWQNDGDFFQESRPGGQLDTIFGWGSFPQGSFPENQITRDGLLIYTLVTDYYKQLQEREPTLRTRDLDNPFDSSLRDGFISSTPVTEIRIIERRYPTPEPVPQSEPVRGLW